MTYLWFFVRAPTQPLRRRNLLKQGTKPKFTKTLVHILVHVLGMPIVQLGGQTFISWQTVIALGSRIAYNEPA